LCLTCPAAWTGPSQKCPDCKAKERARWRAKAKRPEDRQARQAAWAGMDWSQPNTVIARAMGVSVNAVTYQRIKAGRSYGRRGRPKKSVDASARPIRPCQAGRAVLGLEPTDNRSTTMKRAILITLLAQAFGWGLVACKSAAENERLARLGDIAITYAERRGVISPADAADLRAAGIVAVGQPAVTATK
jgi:hypothetical protein